MESVERRKAGGSRQLAEGARLEAKSSIERGKEFASYWHIKSGCEKFIDCTDALPRCQLKSTVPIRPQLQILCFVSFPALAHLEAKAVDDRDRGRRPGSYTA